MGCINADGSLTNTARKVMRGLQTPACDTEIAAQISFPVYLVRSSLRELEKLGLITEADGKYTITDLGTEHLEKEP